MTGITLTNCDIFTGTDVLYEHAVVIENGKIVELPKIQELPSSAEVIDLGGQSVAPGFIDVQVNGGGGVLFNDDPSAATIARIAKAHRRFGTTSILPTFITGTAEGMRLASEAVRAVLRSDPGGVRGIHFEGPFLNPKKAGVHDKARIRTPTPEDIGLLDSERGGRTLVTLAPEMVDPLFIAALKERGFLVSAGHSLATYSEATGGFAAGITLVTHLFNAMSPLGSREPGMVGAALDDKRVWCSIIVDGFHVDFAAVRIAWKSKARGRMFLVTDAMPPVGAEAQTFTLGPYEISVDNGRCVTADGVLAGSALDMATAVRNCIQKVGIPADEALRMASTYPAEYLGLDSELGRIAPGYTADLVVFNNQIQVSSVVVGGILEYID